MSYYHSLTRKGLIPTFSGDIAVPRCVNETFGKPDVTNVLFLEAEVECDLMHGASVSAARGFMLPDCVEEYEAGILGFPGNPSNIAA